MDKNLKVLKIEEREYVTVLMPPIRAVALHARLLSMLGGTVSKILPQDMDDDGKALAIIAGALQGIDPAALPGLIVDMTSQVKLGDEYLDKTNFDVHFSAHPGDIYPLATWVIWLNVKPFLAKSGPAWSSLMQAVGLKLKKTGQTFTS